MRELKVAVIGGGYMARAHSVALAALPVYIDDLPLHPVRELICDIDEEHAADAARRLGFNRHATDWRAAVEDPGIDVVDIVLPNHLHLEVVQAAIAAGKHVTCEKPLANTATDSAEVLAAAEKAGIVHQMGLNWRLAPAVQFARHLVEDGALGELRDFRGFWLADFGADASSPMSWKYQKAHAGTGVLGDTGSHVIDFARFLLGEFASVCGLSRIHVPERTPSGGGAPQPVDVEDDAAFLAEFVGGSYGYIQLTRSSQGRKNHCGFEIHGSHGSIVFGWERMNEIQVYDARDSKANQGFRTILLGPAHPYGGLFWRVPGYQIGFNETKVLQFMELVRAIDGSGTVQTTFADGVRLKEVEEAVEASIATRSWRDVEPQMT